MLPRRGSAVLMAVLLACAVPWVMWNQGRPMATKINIFDLDRETLYFVNRPDLLSAYVDVADECARQRCRHVALVCGGDDWEYPLWVMLRARMGDPVVIEHVGVANEAAALLASPPGTPGADEPMGLIDLNADPIRFVPPPDWRPVRPP